MSTYVSLETPPIEMGIIGERVDLLSLGVIQINLQRIADKVAHDLLVAEGILAPGWRWSNYPSRWFQPEYPRFVQLDVAQAHAGSFDSTLAIAVLATLADPHAVAILENLASNVIWAIGTSGLRGVTREFAHHLPVPSRFRRQDRDPYQVEALVRDSILVAEQNPNIKAIRYRASGAEVILDLEFYRGQQDRRR
ncbi:MAG TPA: hypothetical protein DEP84_12130 [Chloroflexi bacterium]|nr:hypothetical protein [Chloroflexota bacterium]